MMQCPNCNKIISTFNPQESLVKSQIYCYYCNTFFPLPLTLREIKKCSCGVNFNEVYKNRLLNCDLCYKTFNEEIKIFFDTSSLDFLYTVEKNFIRNYIINLKENKMIYSRYNLFKDLFESQLQEKQNIFSLLKKINEIPILTQNYDIIIRVRYSRNIPKIPYNLSFKEIQALSLILLNSKFFLLNDIKKYFNIKYLNDYGKIKEFLQKKDIHFSNKNYQNISYFLVENNQDKEEYLTRIYCGDEDHFRMEMFYFIGNSDWEKKFLNVINTIIYMFKFYLFLDGIFLWQVSPEYGFLTHCPSNAGSGIRIYLKIKLNPKNSTKIFYFFQRNSFFKRLKNYSIRGDMGENSKIEEYITIGWDLPYLDLKNFEDEIKKKLIYWFYEIHSFTKIYLK
jgi:hypothetical protein